MQIWPFVHEMNFQANYKMFDIKMSDVGLGSRVDLVQRMQLDGDLQDVWIMFDHMKRVKCYTTFARHVYDFCYSKVKIIVLCDMKSEIHDAQTYLWHGFNNIITVTHLSMRSA